MSVISLDWRRQIEPADLLDKIHEVLTALDVDGYYPVELSASSALGATAFERINNVPMIVRHAVAKNKHLSGQSAYFVNFVFVAYKFADMISYQQTRKARLFEYMCKDDEFKPAMVKKIVRDLALTLDVHPSSLGLLHENPGSVCLPKGVTIKTTLVTNVFSWSQVKKGLSGPKNDIPELILKMHAIVKSKTYARAVIVLEHRNVDLSAANIAEQLEGVIVVKTAGYASMATKEFLHLLSKDARFKNVPFLFFSDHDLHGFQIFLTLKYGSTASSWASASQVCSKLTWAGPTVKELRATVLKHAEFKKSEDLAKSIGEDEATLTAETWRTAMMAKVDQALKQKINETDRALMRWMERTGVLGNEDALAEEARRIVRDGSKFGLSRLTLIRPDGMELFLVEKAEELAPQRTKVPVTVTTAKISQRAQGFNQIPSQIGSEALMSGALHTSDALQLQGGPSEEIADALIV